MTNYQNLSWRGKRKFTLALNKSWQEQAKTAIEQGQSLKDFLASVHYDNRSIARQAYLKAESELRKTAAQ